MVVLLFSCCVFCFFSLSPPPPPACSGLIVLTLAICWMPNQIRRIMAASRPKHDWTRAYFQAYMTLLPFSDTFFYLSSVINPLLYNVSSRQFRAVFWQVLRCRLTLLHANQERRLRGLAASASASASPGDSARSRRPLLRLASRRSSSSSARSSPKVFLSTFQSEAGAGAKPQPEPQPSSPESPEPGSETAPASAAAENGVQEHEV